VLDICLPTLPVLMSIEMEWHILRPQFPVCSLLGLQLASILLIAPILPCHAKM
jgi:hypothetical protein